MFLILNFILTCSIGLNGSAKDSCVNEYAIKKSKILLKQYKSGSFGEIKNKNSVIVFDNIGDTSFQELASYSIINAKWIFDAVRKTNKKIRIKDFDNFYPKLKYKVVWYSCEELVSKEINKRFFKLYFSFSAIFDGWSEIVLIELINDSANERTGYHEFLKGTKSVCIKYLGSEYG